MELAPSDATPTRIASLAPHPAGLARNCLQAPSIAVADLLLRSPPIQLCANRARALFRGHRQQRWQRTLAAHDWFPAPDRGTSIPIHSSPQAFFETYHGPVPKALLRA